MTQPPYRSPDDHSMRRLALFVTALIVIVAIGSRPAHSGSTKDFCVCLPSRAGLMLKSMVNRSTVKTVQAASIQRIADESTTAQ